MIRGNGAEPVEGDALDEDRLAFGDLYGDRDFVLCVVELHVDVDDFRLRITTISVVRLDALDVAIELRAIEESLARPWQKAAFLRRENRFQLLRLDGVRAAEIDGRHLDVARLAARGGRYRQQTGSSQRVFASPSRRAVGLLLPAGLVCPALARFECAARAAGF